MRWVMRGAGQAARTARNVLATEQLSQLGKLCAPSQLLESAAEEDEPMDVSDRRQGRNPRTQHGHPAEDVWIPAQLIERSYFGMVGAEISQEIACRTTIETSRLGGQCGTNRMLKKSLTALLVETKARL